MVRQSDDLQGDQMEGQVPDGTGTGTDAAMALLLGRLVSARFRPIPTRGAGAALLLGLDPDTLAPMVECLAGEPPVTRRRRRRRFGTP